MFSKSYLISIGDLSDVLDGNGTILHVMKYIELDNDRFEIEAALTVQKQPNTMRDHIGFSLPTISALDNPLTLGDWKIKKILIATTEYTRYDLGKVFITRKFSSEYPTLRGCAQLLPLSDAEKLICNIRGLSYE